VWCRTERHRFLPVADGQEKASNVKERLAHEG